jgi:hypothetical protein
VAAAVRLLVLGILVCAYGLLGTAVDLERTNAAQFTDPTCTPGIEDDTPLEDLLMLDPEWMLPAALATPEQRVRALLARSPWPPYLHAQALAVIGCESTYNPNAVGDDGLALGLLQIRTDYHPRLARWDLLDPHQNLIAGYVVYLQSGGSWDPWTCKP